MVNLTANKFKKSAATQRRRSSTQQQNKEKAVMLYLFNRGSACAHHDMLEYDSVYIRSTNVSDEPTLSLFMMERP